MLVFLFGCTSKSIHPLKSASRKNCSPEGLRYADEYYFRVKKIPSQELINKTNNFFQSHNNKFQSCYQEYLKANRVEKKEFQVCALLEIEKPGKLKFLDIADSINHLNDNLFQCLNKNFQKLDYLSLATQEDILFMFPINLL